MPTYSVDVNFSGPLFDGKFPAAAHEFILRAVKKLADTGADWIKIDAEGMDRSGRGGTGRAAAGVEVQTRGDGYAIWGAQRQGDVWWPWLEGKSKRNSTTRFGGYHTFRNTKSKLQDHMQAIIQPDLDEFIAEVGGRE